MNDKLLTTFQTVAEEGSFTKAAEKLYVSHTAVIKQINLLETRLDVKLFDRRKRGVKLTSAGQVLYAEAMQLVKTSEQAIERVRAAHRAEQKTLRVGTSMFFPCRDFMDLWVEIREKCAEYPLKVIPFDDDLKRVPRIGEDFDFIISAYNSKWYKDRYDFLPVGKYRLCVAVPRTHALAKKKAISIRDLDGYPLMLMHSGSSPINSLIRRDIAQQHLGINLVDIHTDYSASTYDLAVERNCPLLSIECWDRVHPDMKSIPLSGPYELPYGIVYSRTPSENMKAFLAIIKELIPCESCSVSHL